MGGAGKIQKNDPNKSVFALKYFDVPIQTKIKND